MGALLIASPKVPGTQGFTSPSDVQMLKSTGKGHPFKTWQPLAW